MAVKRTPEQEEVVKNRGGALLVSAAAGSGKTRVLVERLMDYILQEGRNIDEFLIITFTRAAAEELRARIAKEIAEALAAQPDHAHLRQQTVRLYETQISTIHAFCTVLLRQWGHLLDIPGDFALCEDEEAQVLMTRTLNQVLEARYEEIDPTGPFARLLDVLSKGRDDSRLLEITLDIYGKIQSYPDPLAWLASQREALDLSAVTDVGQTPWGSLLLEEAGQTAAYWADQMARACDLAQKEAGLEKAYGDSLQATRRSLEAFVQAAGTSWDEAARVEIVFPKLKAARGVEDPALQEQIKSIRARCKKAVEELTQTVSGPSAPLLADMALVYPAMLGLLDLVEDFSRAYEAAKKQRSLLDFSDLEHLAVRLLVDEAGGPTPLARQWGARYTEIMVDEYQDTNQVQNTIFQALSREGRNLFMVGDVKQSIYRFRLADPTIFLEKYRTFPPYDQAQVGQERRITLSKNFRSRPQVLEAANDLFRAIMSRRLGEMDYTDGEALYPGGTFPAGEGYETEFHVLDFTEDPAYTEEKQNRNALEARFVAKEITELLQSGFPVSDGAGGTRPVRLDDIAILLRSPGPVRRYYTQALEEQGVGWSAEEGGDLFAASEVSVALSWLQIIDNPQQDIPLLAVLRSPLVGMTGDRLAEIRGLAEGTFYTALQAAGAQGWEDCRSFLGQLEALRFGAGEESSHHLLWSLYRQTDMLEVYSSLPGGEKRRENLLSFYELARRFEGAGHKGLFGFLLHLDRVRESGGLPAMPAAPKEEAGVKILSIHRSKGLEYPVVFLCGLGRRINYGDLQKPVLFHPRLGLGPKGLDRETMVEFTTLARTGVALALKKELLAEEMRLLYVAMTRAKEKLILTHALAYGRGDLRNLAESVSYPADPRVLAGCTSVGQWLLLTALARPEGGELRAAIGREELPLPAASLGPSWRIAYHGGGVSQRGSSRRSPCKAARHAALPPEELLAQLRWRYPYEASAATPAKVTATQVADQDPEEAGWFLLRDQGSGEPAPFYRPQFAQASLGLTPAQRGTAVHTVMQSIRLDRTGSVEQVQAELDRLTGAHYLTEAQAQAVDPAAVARFFAGDLGRQLRGSRNLHREYPFSVLTEARRFFPQAPAGEEVLLQGVIDCWFETAEGITLVDFKTDHVSAEHLAQRSQRYRGQMAAYAYALEEVTGIPVVRRVLWFLVPNLGVELS